MSEVLVRLEVAPSRRFFGVGTLAGLGVVMLYIAIISPPAQVLMLAILVLIGAAFLGAAKKLWDATAESLIMTREDITTSSGRLLCRIDDIEKIDRGFFAFKPTNGFLVLLKEPTTRSWSPGLWWHLGKHIGIGGVTSPRQAKEMSAMISMMIVERNAGFKR